MAPLEVLVTGGAGFIGSNLALELEKNRHKVTIVDNLFSGTENNLVDFKGKFMNSDISKQVKFPGEFDIIFHMAAITDPRYEKDEDMYEKNLNGFKLMLGLALKSNSKFVYASTANLYGNGPIPMREDQKKEIITEYGKSKLEMDEMAGGHFGKMHVVGLRYFNVFGPREAHKGRSASMIYHLYKAMREGRVPRLFEFGEQKRDHIYVKDAVNATIKAINAPSGIYNVGTGIATDFNELVEILNETLGTKLETEYFKMPYDPRTYQTNTQADTTSAEKNLGFRAGFSLKEGIKDYIKWLEENTS